MSIEISRQLLCLCAAMRRIAKMVSQKIDAEFFPQVGLEVCFFLWGLFLGNRVRLPDPRSSRIREHIFMGSIICDHFIISPLALFSSFIFALIFVFFFSQLKMSLRHLISLYKFRLNAYCVPILVHCVAHELVHKTLRLFCKHLTVKCRKVSL